MKVSFITPTQISLLDITSMGDSVKRLDDSSLGTFDSGLKYAIALCLRENVDLTITVPGEPRIHENWAEQSRDTISFSTFIEVSPTTGKQKELIAVDVTTEYMGGAPMNSHDMREPSCPETYRVTTGFAKALGFNWEPYMILRELWSNMLDEGGYVSEECPDETFQGTVMTLSFEEDSEFAEIWNNRHLYINEKEPLYKISDKVEALENAEGYLRIYKQSILVYSDEKVPSRFAYNVKLGEIDERRILSNVYNVESSIVDAIRYTHNEGFLREIITRDFKAHKKEFLSNFSNYYTASDLIHNIAVEVYTEFGEVSSYDWLIDSIKKRKDCKIGGKIIKTIDDSVWSYSTPVRIETAPIQISEPSIEVEGEVLESKFSAEIRKYYNFNLDCEVKIAKLKGSKCVADKFEKCIIIDESFDIQTDFGTFMIEYIDLSYEGNAVKCLGEYIVKLLRK